MPSIAITDTSSLTADLTLLDDSVLGKTPSSVLHFLRADVIGALDQTLDKVQINSLSLGFNYSPVFTLSGGTAAFTAGGGLTGELFLYPATTDGTPSPLFPTDQYGTDIEMNGKYYLALQFQLSLTPELDKAAGAFTLSPNASFTSTATLYLPFSRNAAGAYPMLKDALASLFQAFTLPSSIPDMRSLPIGSVFTYDAQGTVAFQGEFDVLAAVNPTASLGFSETYGPINIVAGPSVTLGGGFSLTGEFQVRMWNKDGNVIELGYYKQRDTSFSVAFDASDGLAVTVGGYDVIAKIYSLLGSAGSLDDAFLKTIPASVADDVQAAYQAAVQTKLSIAVDAECDTSLTNQVAFSWDFDARTMDADAYAAFRQAMLGDLSPLLSSKPLPAGVAKVGSVFDKLRTVNHTFNFNFLGLFDYASVNEAALHMTVKASEDGQVVIADQASLTRLSATATPFVKSDLLRKVLTEDFVATVGYSSSLGPIAPDMEVTYSYYDYLRHGSSSDLQTFVSTAVILTGLEQAEKDWAELLHSGPASQSASMLASLIYDKTTSIHLFLDSHANARGVEDYQKIARQALIITPQLGLNSTFVSFLRDDAQWQELVDAGAPGNFYAALGADQAPPPQWAVVAYTWKQHVLDWSKAMHAAAQALEQVQQYVTQNPKLDLLTDSGFRQRRQTLASQLKTAVQATPLFNDTLGINTIYLTARPTRELINISYAGRAATYQV